MAVDERAADRVRAVLRRRRNVTEKRMFGGIAFLVHGNMACGLIEDDLVLRVGKEEAARLLGSKHVRPMDFTGKPLAGYIYAAPAAYRTAAALERLVDLALRFTRTLPRKGASP